MVAGFIKHEKIWLLNERPGERENIPLASGERPDLLLQAARQAKLIQQSGGTIFSRIPVRRVVGFTRALVPFENRRQSSVVPGWNGAHCQFEFPQFHPHFVNVVEQQIANRRGLTCLEVLRHVANASVALANDRPGNRIQGPGDDLNQCGFP